MIDVLQLKDKILDMAIQGKLVTPDTNVDNINNFRKTLNIASIDYEVEYDHPSIYTITDIQSLLTLRTGASFAKEKASTIKKDNYIRVLRGGNISPLSYSFRYDDIYIPVEELKNNIIVKINDIISPAVTSLDNVGKFGRITDINEDFTVGGFVFLISPKINNDVFSKYMLYYLSSSIFRTKLKSITKKSGSAFYNINKELFNKIMIAIPSFEEQERIVAKIEELFAIVDKLENDQIDVENYKQLAKDKILDLAIKGFLTNKAENYVEYQPFSIPKTWNFMYGKDCLKDMESTKPSGEYFNYIDIESIDNKKHLICDVKKVKTKSAPSRATRKVHFGDTLFSMVRPYLENIALVDNEDYNTAIASTGFFVCSPNENLDSNYLFYLMTSRYVINGLMKFMHGNNSPSINGGNILNFLFPIPPLSEQKMIVKKIQELFALLDLLN